MSAVDDPKTYGRARLGFADEADVDEFAETLGRFERGEIGPDAWRAFRLVRGTYGQRQAEDAQMLRVKIPQGILTGPQIHALADVADRYSRGFGHITTRQNVQFHFMKLHDVEPAMRLMADAGLTTREACGSAVRNITGCPLAGVAADEIFDVTPYADALTRHLLRHPLSSRLPRKFKIGFEGCPVDHTRTGINDIGFRAALGPGGTRGFRITVAGGTSIMPRSGALLHDFLPAAEIFDVADAILRVYAALGDYQHKQQPSQVPDQEPRLGALARRYRTSLAAVHGEPGRTFPFDPDDPPVEEAPEWIPHPAPAPAELAARAATAELHGPGIHPAPIEAGPDGFDRWLRTNVHAQKQDGFAAVVVTIPLGDVTAAQLRIFADLASAYGDGTLRITTDQNALFRWVRAARIAEFYSALTATGFGLANAGTIADVVSCPGAESCRLAVTQSRGLGRLLGDHLRAQADTAESVRRTSRSAAARTAAACITSRRSASRAASASWAFVPCLSTSSWPAAAPTPKGPRSDASSRRFRHAGAPKRSTAWSRSIARNASPTRAWRSSCAARTSPGSRARCRISRRSRKRPRTRRTSSTWRRTKRSRRKCSTENAARN
jgi:sulfite reductase (NADPH) hemoprotein beta-component